MPQTQEWIKKKLAEESVTYWTEMRLTKEVQALQERVKKLEEDMAYKIRKQK